MCVYVCEKMGGGGGGAFTLTQGQETEAWLVGFELRQRQM